MAKKFEVIISENVGKRHIRWAHENAEGLADSDGGWQNDLAAVVETGSMIMWQLEQAFPFLAEASEGENND